MATLSPRKLVSRSRLERQPLLTADQEQSLARAWRDEGDPSARYRLITSNMGLVVSLASRFACRSVPPHELIAEGQVGLIMAVDRFDPGCECRFSTYATYWIRHSISEAFARGTERGRLNRADLQSVRQLERCESQHKLKTGRVPTLTELADTLGWRVERVRLVSSYQLTGGGQDSLDDVDARAPRGIISAPDSKPEFESESTSEQLGRDVTSLIEALPEHERAAIKLRFGFEGGQSRTIDAVAAVMGRTASDVRGLIASGIKRLSRTCKP